MSLLRPTWFSISAFPIAVVGMVIIMMLPLPPLALDVLLMLNISLAVLLIVAVIYCQQAEQLTALPAILLLTTLYRLGINVSTTRQLLAEGEAPATVVAFGNFVVHGNIVVGAVVFAIITLVQFLVIAKGSERVAEVAARFALDAMPGKQMAIDADIRSGILSLAEAKKRRELLQRESKLYGSLDGAMKFVKGDAVAGLCITLVNVLGGLFVGMQQHNLSLTEALETYTLFAIGDGLASQIPALLVAVAAGVAVTRVSGDEGMHLADDVLEQLTSEPKALASAAVVIALLGCIPGLPGVPFWLMSAGLLMISAQRVQQFQRKEAAKKEEAFRPVVVPGLLLQLASNAAAELQRTGALAAKAQQLRSALFEGIGLYVHDIQFEILTASSAPLVTLQYQGEAFCTLLPDEPRLVSLEDWILQAISDFVHKRKVELVDDTQVRLLFEVHRSSCEDIINSLVPAKLSVTELTAILRALLAENISIRNFAKILQAIADCEFLENDAWSAIDQHGLRKCQLDKRVAHVRQALARSISEKVRTHTQGELYMLDAELDMLLTDGVRIGGAIDPRIEDDVRNACEQVRAERERLSIVCSALVRRRVAQLVPSEVLVVSFEELQPAREFRVVGYIGREGVRLAENTRVETSHRMTQDEPVAGQAYRESTTAL